MGLNKAEYSYECEETLHLYGQTSDGESMDGLVALIYINGEPAEVQLTAKQKDYLSGFLLDKSRGAIYADTQFGEDRYSREDQL